MKIEYYDKYDKKNHTVEINNCDYTMPQLKEIFGGSEVEYYHWGIRFIYDTPDSDTIWNTDIHSDGSVELFHIGKGVGCIESTDEEYASVAEYVAEYIGREMLHDIPLPKKFKKRWEISYKMKGEDNCIFCLQDKFTAYTAGEAVNSAMKDFAENIRFDGGTCSIKDGAITEVTEEGIVEYYSFRAS